MLDLPDIVEPQPIYRKGLETEYYYTTIEVAHPDFERVEPRSDGLINNPFMYNYFAIESLPGHFYYRRKR